MIEGKFQKIQRRRKRRWGLREYCELLRLDYKAVVRYFHMHMQKAFFLGIEDLIDVFHELYLSSNTFMSLMQRWHGPILISIGLFLIWILKKERKRSNLIQNKWLIWVSGAWLLFILNFGLGWLIITCAILSCLPIRLSFSCSMWKSVENQKDF